jgi:1-acyl-sn-glycerol-3-phosphate acyltransferase
VHLSDRVAAPPARVPNSGAEEGAGLQRSTSARLAVAVRAVTRLSACTAHLLGGVATCLVVFPRLDAAARRARVTAWSARLLRCLDIRLAVEGRLESGPALLVANHVSWLDIVVLQAIGAARFVSKADVRRWPVVGFLAAQAGTLFIERSRRRDAVRVVHEVAGALRAGACIAVFPEGTTGAGPAVLPFHANLLQAAVGAQVPLQPVALRYGDAGSPFSTAAPFIGAMTLVGSLWRIACAEGLAAHASFASPVEAAGADRRELADATRACIQALLDAAAGDREGLPGPEAAGHRPVTATA